MTFPLPENPRLLADPDIYSAVRDYVAMYALPALDPASIVHGWHNLELQPPASDDYAVISVVRHARQGSNAETFHTTGPGIDEPGVTTLKTLIDCVVQVDFCAFTDDARRRAQSLETVSGSTVGARFFQALGLLGVHAENVREVALTGREKVHPLPLTGDGEVLVRRYMTRLHLPYWTGLEMEIPWFDDVDVERIENADAHHPPKE